MERFARRIVLIRAANEERRVRVRVCIGSPWFGFRRDVMNPKRAIKRRWCEKARFINGLRNDSRKCQLLNHSALLHALNHSSEVVRLSDPRCVSVQ